MSEINKTQLAVHSNQPMTINAAPSLMDTMKIAEIFYKSRIVKSIESEAQACAKILAGQEMGIGPMASLSQIHLVDGKPTMDATLVGAQIKKSGRYDYRIRESSDVICRVEFFERGESVGISSFSMDQARRAGLATKQVWKSYPEAMLRSRAMTQGARMFCPDVFNGAIYDPSELGAEVELDNAGTMKVVSTETQVQQPRQQRPQRTDDSNKLRELIREVYGALKISPNDKDQAAHAFAINTVAQTIGRDKAPARWSEFSASELERFLDLNHDAIETQSEQVDDVAETHELCEYCLRKDGTHRENCPNAEPPETTEDAG